MYSYKIGENIVYSSSDSEATFANLWQVSVKCLKKLLVTLESFYIVHAYLTLCRLCVPIILKLC